MWGTETLRSRLCWEVACPAGHHCTVHSAALLRARHAMEQTSDALPSQAMLAGCTPTGSQASHRAAGFILLLRLPQAAIDLNPL